MATRLRYCDDTKPGITRRMGKHGWSYWDAEGKRITDRDEIDRLNRIGLPPAYRDAWFCPWPNGHLQAVGWDEKGRKQYRYHTAFREAREAYKFERCADFGRALPRLRARVEVDLARRDLCRERAIAAVVRLLDCSHLRVGNEGYARDNGSYGATTLRKHHAIVGSRRFQLHFRAKSGKERRIAITDRSLIRFVRKCNDLPGQNLFSWVDESGEARPVTSCDVNAYIRDATGTDFTAKHFRTWGASVIAFQTITGSSEPIDLRAMLAPVADALGNTPAIARKAYVHPLLIDLVKSGRAQLHAQTRLPRRTRYLDRLERALIALLDDAAPTRRAA